MLKFFTALMAAIQVIPQLLSLADQVVVNVEQGLGQIPGITGSQKLAAAKAKIDSFLKDATTNAAQLASIQTILTPVINAAVAAFNAAGLFTHKEKTPTESTNDAPQPAAHS